MRWGVRKKTTRKPRKSISEMSNEELQEAITRGNLERQYMGLQPKSTPSRLASKYRDKFEEKLTNAAAQMSLNAVMASSDFAMSRLKTPGSRAYTKHGEKIYNVYKNHIRR
nr:MAG TPA: hypothetical protein [Caudoviricetes sp.]